MPTIDQRILIPAPPDAVWAYISDLRHNVNWQVDCENVSLLTPSRQGPGTRWRSTIPRGHDVILQITAWYNGLGYEYTYVDGAPFKQSVGRIRLQELPEGTVVQWTFNYETGGLLGGLRTNARGFENAMAESLRKLYKVFQNTSQRRELEAKSLMRDDPGVEARAQYKPRHPSAIEDRPAAPVQPASSTTPVIDEPSPTFADDTQPKPILNRASAPIISEPPVSDDDNRHIPVVSSTGTSAPLIDEPPITIEDTKPRPSVVTETAAPDRRFEPPAGVRRETPPPIVPFDEPDFLRDLDQSVPEASSAVTQPTPLPAEMDRFKPPPPAAPTEPIAPVTEESAASIIEPTPLVAAEPIHDTQPIKPVKVGQPAEAAVEEAVDLRPAVGGDSKIHPPVEVGASLSEVLKEPAKPGEVSDDTASIWDVFNIPRPSETQEMRIAEALRAGTFAAPENSSRDAEIEPHPPRMGMRIYLRRRRVKLRRPPTE